MGRLYRFLYLALLFTGCGMGDRTFDEVAPGVVPAQPAYEVDVRPILERRCTRCHAADSGPGYEPLLDTQREAEREACDSWEEIQSGYMPPGAMDPLNAQEMLTFERWALITVGGRSCSGGD